MMTDKEKISFLEKQGIFVVKIDKNEKPILCYSSKKFFQELKQHDEYIRCAKQEVFDDIEKITVFTSDGYETDEYIKLKKKHLPK